MQMAIERFLVHLITSSPPPPYWSNLKRCLCSSVYGIDQIFRVHATLVYLGVISVILVIRDTDIFGTLRLSMNVMIIQHYIYSAYICSPSHNILHAIWGLIWVSKTKYIYAKYVLNRMYSETSEMWTTWDQGKSVHIRGVHISELHNVKDTHGLGNCVHIRRISHLWGVHNERFHRI